MRRAVFLDRDGVLNRAILVDGKPHPPANLEELEISTGAVQACQALREAGFLLIVVTNQPDVSRGTQQRAVVESINEALLSKIQLDDIRVCYHDDQDQCSCRKPLPGLLIQAAKDWQIDLSSSFMVGDRWKDIESGRQAGCRTILIDLAYREALVNAPDLKVLSLSEAADWILRQPQSGVEKRQR